MGTALKVYQEDVKNGMIKRYSKLKDSRIAIWGIGNYGELIYQVLKELGLEDNISYFCDDRDEVNHTKFHEVEVLKPEEILDKDSSVVFVLASSYWESILRKMTEEQKSSMNIFDIPMGEHEFEIAFGTKAKNDKGQPIIFLPEWFEIYDGMRRDGRLQSMSSKILDLLEDNESRVILKNRIEFFTSGRTDFIKDIKISRPIYFHTDYYGSNSWSTDSDEVYFDCGAFEGENIDDFVPFTAKWGGYRKIHIFEPDEKNCLKCHERVEDRRWTDIVIHQTGTGKENAELFFTNDGTDGAFINEKGDTKITIEKLDNYYDEHPTLIKMDIEGAEMDTLIGAKRIITELKPKLAVSIYHKPLDFYEIPLFLHSLVPEYHFKIRHHTEYLYDTVLYAYI